MACSDRPQRLVRHPAFLTLATVLVVIAPVLSAAPPPVPIAIEFLPTGTKATAVIAPHSRFIVSIYQDSPHPTKARLVKNGKSPLIFSGQDATTRLCFFEKPASIGDSSPSWMESFGKNSPVSLQAITTSGAIPCTYVEWVNQVGEKVLPLGLLSITFIGNLPPSGTPLVDANGKIVGLILQKVSARTAYAIPAQAIRRVEHDIEKHRKLVRGWLGISLSTESFVPRITRVWPDSPAAKAGLIEGDILISASGYPTARYPDAVNALFYAIPGIPTPVQISRKNQRISCQIVPIAQKPSE